MEEDKKGQQEPTNETPKPLNKPNTGSPKDPKKTPETRKIVLNLITVIFSFLVIGVILVLSQRLQVTQTPQPKQFSDLVSELRKGTVSKIEVSADRKEITAEVYKNLDNKQRAEVNTEVYPNISVESNSSVLENINNALGKDQSIKVGTSDGEVVYTEKTKAWYVTFIENGNIWYFVLILIVVGMAIFFIRRVSDTNNRAISFGNSKARVFDELDDKEKITFKDVAGNEEAKQELTEVVDFLKRPEEYAKMGAKIPKGVLLVGSPGNGKTLMAKAVAGEAKVPFFYVSGSEFVEMFVGVGAGRVRDLFKRAKKKAPCVVFIDEIDAVGRQRGAGLGGGNDEREQTLNQILVEMDGFEPTASLIVIGATNRPDVLDPALLRPGRFDRQVTVTAPDRKEREKILEVHARNKKMAKDIDLGVIAKRTPGFSGADLMNVLNEAAILAVREKKKEVDNTILREAIEKVALGPSLKTKIITEKQKKLTAYHEAGHALTASVLPQAQKVQKVTIIPRGRAAGYTFHVDDDNDAITKTKGEFMSEITVLFGGYCVEEVVFGEVSTGGSNDLSKASEIAENMVKKYGMSNLGPVSFKTDGGMTFLGRDMVEKQQYSEEIAKQIDLEIERIIRECYHECKKIIVKFRPYLDKIASTLIEEEVLEFEDFNKIIGEIMNSYTLVSAKTKLA
jgi:cell division protease FtsH